MSANFKIAFKRSNGNLHVTPKGDFDGGSAWALIHLLHDKYDGQGQVFIDTRQLRTIHPFGCVTFQNRLDLKQLPVNRLFFKGEKGHELAPMGSKVLVTAKTSRCGCNGNCGNCANCHCSEEEDK